MKKSFLIFIIAGFIFVSCSHDSVLKPSKSDAPKAVNTEDFVYLNKESMQIPAKMAGKNAFLITYYNSQEKKDNRSIDKNVDYSCFDHIPYNLEVLDIPLGEELSRGVYASEEPNFDKMSVGSIYNFYVLYDGNKSSKKFIKKFDGKNCNIWYFRSADKSFINLEDSDFELLANKFDDIYSAETKIFGSNVPNRFYSNTISYDACKRKVNILVYDIKNDAEESQTGGTFGYFSSKDFYERKSPYGYDTFVNSNLSECIYLDSYFYAKESTKKDAISTLAHEFQHLIYFVGKHLNYNLNDITWCSEMMSMVAEEIFQKKLDIDDLSSPKNRLRFFKYGSNFGFTDKVWSYCPDNNLNGTFEYANTYAFGSYLLHKFGIKTIKKIATNNYEGIESFNYGIPGEDSFDTEFYRFGRYYVEGMLDSIDTEGYELDEINLHDTRWKNDNSVIKNFYNLSDFSRIYSTNPLIWDAGTSPTPFFPQGFYVNYFGIVPDSGMTITNCIVNDPDIVQFVLLK